jgi:hypothetical protein
MTPNNRCFKQVWCLAWTAASDIYQGSMDRTFLHFVSSVAGQTGEPMRSRPIHGSTFRRCDIASLAAAALHVHFFGPSATLEPVRSMGDPVHFIAGAGSVSHPTRSSAMIELIALTLRLSVESGCRFRMLGAPIQT